ncbi:MAG: sigma-70 family RNA polymerase sigma factor [Actinophytocola sp.]|nr:sigma-70 family RNA polymerase sigma factor [Actinophytocola sp.]
MRCRKWWTASSEENGTDDAEAVARACGGDRDAYGVLVARYTADAHRTAFLLGAGDDADDVVQEAFVKAFRGLRRFRAGAAFRPWLLRIVANETRNLQRSRRRRSAATDRLAQTLPDAVDPDGPESRLLTAEARAALLAAVHALPDRDRRVVACRYFLDLSEAETAQVLGWRRGTVKSRLSRALVKLRPALTTAAHQEARHG